MALGARGAYGELTGTGDYALEPTLGERLLAGELALELAMRDDPQHEPKLIHARPLYADTDLSDRGKQLTVVWNRLADEWEEDEDARIKLFDAVFELLPQLGGPDEVAYGFSPEEPEVIWRQQIQTATGPAQVAIKLPMALSGYEYYRDKLKFERPIDGSIDNDRNLTLRDLGEAFRRFQEGWPITDRLKWRLKGESDSPRRDMKDRDSTRAFVERLILLGCLAKPSGSIRELRYELAYDVIADGGPAKPRRGRVEGADPDADAQKEFPPLDTDAVLRMLGRDMQMSDEELLRRHFAPELSRARRDLQEAVRLKALVEYMLVVRAAQRTQG